MSRLKTAANANDVGDIFAYYSLVCNQEKLPFLAVKIFSTDYDPEV